MLNICAQLLSDPDDPEWLVPAQISVARASPSNPGIPPSSLMAWLKVKPALQGAVLAGFDRQYINPHAFSPSDSASTLRLEQIAAAAEVVARTAFSAATGSAPEALPVSAGVLTWWRWLCVSQG